MVISFAMTLCIGWCGWTYATRGVVLGVCHLSFLFNVQKRADFSLTSSDAIQCAKNKWRGVGIGVGISIRQ